MSGNSLRGQTFSGMGTKLGPSAAMFLRRSMHKVWVPAYRKASTWVTGYLKASAQERQAIIDTKLLTLVSTPESKQLIAQDLTKSVGGIRAAIELRMDLQKLPDSSSSKAVQLDECVQNWLAVAFCVDSLALQQITFDSGGSSLEIIARADTVHAVRSISALKKRLQKSRRCYALFHPALPNFPLAFIHVALTSDLANSMSSLDELMDSTAPTHAMFYSVNSTSPAFRGLSLAPHLIKETVRDLQEHCPSIKVFSTLSPIPNFVKWLSKEKGFGGLPETLLPNVRAAAALLSQPQASAEEAAAANAALAVTDAQAWQRVVDAIVSRPQEWAGSEGIRELLKDPLVWLAAKYIVTTRTAKDGTRGSIEPVANFHMGNGAEFHRLNWMGNPGLPGLRASAGMMVNYLYDLPALDANAAMFKHPAGEGAETAVATAVASAVPGTGTVEAGDGAPREGLQLAVGESVRAILSRR